mmetsp:Transcript_26778/g.36803  ORF Transcript_26778/g.36803 Transcript_26778/m.36803 type:complete len:232 (+) Transcript_26778:975-1670(+)
METQSLCRPLRRSHLQPPSSHWLRTDDEHQGVQDIDAAAAAAACPPACPPAYLPACLLLRDTTALVLGLAACTPFACYDFAGERKARCHSPMIDLLPRKAQHHPVMSQAHARVQQEEIAYSSRLHWPCAVEPAPVPASSGSGLSQRVHELGAVEHAPVQTLHGDVETCAELPAALDGQPFDTGLLVGLDGWQLVRFHTHADPPPRAVGCRSDYLGCLGGASASVCCSHLSS